MNKYKIIGLSVLSLFVLYLFYEVYNSSKIPDHIHSIDDKAHDERTDDEKIIVLERTLQKEPKNINAMLELSDLYVKTSQVSKAKRLIDNVLEIEPANKTAQDKLKAIERL